MKYKEMQKALFSLQPFRLFALNCFLSALGNGMSYIAMIWLIIVRNNSISTITLLIICFWLPTVIIGSLCGVCADRYNKKNLLIIANVTRMIILLVFSFYFFKRSILMIYVLASLLGIFLSLYMPASVAIRKEIVKPDLLLFANSSIDVAYEIGGVIGMGLSGILLTYYSFSTVLIINSICFFLAILSLFKMKVNSNLERPLPLNLINNFFNELKSGIKYVYTHESLMKIFLAQLLITAGLMTSPILLVDFATHVLKANVSQFGQLEALFSFGVVCGGLLNPYLTQQLGVRLILLIEMFCLGILFIVFSTLFNIQCGLVIYYFIGFCFSGLALISTIAQKMTEQAYQGRAQATFNSAAGIAILIIYIAINLVSHYVTIDFLYLCQAALILCSLVLLSQKSYYEIMFIKS